METATIDNLDLELVEYFEYLDDLRDSGATNMFGAGPYLSDAFELDSKTANQIVASWMRTFSAGKTAADRAEVAMLAARKVQP